MALFMENFLGVIFLGACCENLVIIYSVDKRNTGVRINNPEFVNGFIMKGIAVIGFVLFFSGDPMVI